MIAPVYEQNATGRTLYFPEPMKLIRFRKGEVREEEVYEKGYSYVEMPLGDVCVFLKENRILLLSDGGESIAEVNFDHPHIHCFGNHIKPYEYYTDDGESRKCDFDRLIRVISCNMPTAG